MEAKTPYDYITTTVNGISLRDAYLNGGKAGIREMVELIKRYPIMGLGFQSALKAKLKEWGIE